MISFDFAYASTCDFTLPRTSGPSVNAHVMKAQSVPSPNYEKMREQIEGDRIPQPSK